MITLQNESLKIDISPIGGELQSIYDKKDKIEYMWQGNPEYWSGKAPNLFPYIARLKDDCYFYQGQRYEMKRHGFLRHTELSVEIHTDDMVVFSMADSEFTRNQYPFAFRFLLQYRLTGRMLQIIYSVENRDDKTMYFGVGGHPGFGIPLEKNQKFEDYYLEFSEKCEPQQILFSDSCFVLDKTAPYPLEDGRKIQLKHELFDGDALVLKNAAHSVSLKSGQSRHMITVQYPDMEYIGFWHKPHSDAGYVCIEPWSSLPAREDGITDLEKQQDLVRLESGKMYENKWSVSCI